MLRRTSSIGPSPGGGTASTIAVSCSSTYQPLYPACSSETDDLVDAGVTRAERPEHPSLYGGDEVELAGAQPDAHGIVDVLEVHVRDPVREGPHDLERVGAAEREMAGVEADGDVRAREHAFDVLVALDHGAPVRMEHVDDPVFGRCLVEEWERRQQVIPLRVGQIDPGRPVVVDDRGRVDETGTQRREERRSAAYLCDRRLQLRRIVEDDRQEASHELEALALEQRSRPCRVVPEVAVRPGLGRDDAQRSHLREHAFRRQLDAPAGHLAHTPRDRAGG